MEKSQHTDFNEDIRLMKALVWPVVTYGSTRHLRSSSHQLLQKPTTRTHFADRAFRCTAPTVWNSLNSYTVDSGSLAVLVETRDIPIPWDF